MAQFRTTADILDLALQKAGEVTNGNSPYETQALNYLNRVHFAIIAGGTIPVGKDSTIEINEMWPWARAPRPLVLELQPAYETGTVTLTLGDEAGTFSSAPSYSVAGWFLQLKGKDDLFRIASHTAASTSFEIDGEFPDATVSGASFQVVKLDYELVPSYIVIDSSNNKLQFQEAAGTTLTATLASGTYTPAELATQVQTQLTTTGGTPVYTVTYSSTTRKFTIASDRGGGSVFVLVGTGDQADFSAHKTLGFDDENTTNAASVTSTYVLGGIARLVEPIRISKNSYEGSIFGIDPESFQRDYPFNSINEGNPDRFAVIRESPDGTLTVRFNSYVSEKTRIEIEYVPVPRDLKDSSASIPLLPRKHVDVLEDACVFYLMLDKSDDRSQLYATLMQGKLQAMLHQNRASLEKVGKDFARIIPRRDNMRRRRNPFGWEPYT